MFKHYHHHCETLKFQMALVPEPSVLEGELAIEKLKSRKSPGIDQIPAELIKAGGSTIRCAIRKLIIAIWREEELPAEWKESIIVPIHKKGDKTDCNNSEIIPTRCNNCVYSSQWLYSTCFG